LRFLSYDHLFTYAILFVVTFALRLPSFHPNYYQDDEAFYLMSAEKIVDGGVQYVDTWDNKPPVLAWFYSLFVGIFGSAAIYVIRIFTCIYLYISALLLNQFVVDNKLLQRFSLLPAFLLIFLCSVPWYAQELNGEILMNLPIILSVFQLLKVTERSRKNNSHLFFAGVLLGLSFMIKYQAIFVFFGILGAYITIHTPRISETFSLFAGFFMSILVLVGGIYLTGAIEAFWDIGVVYNLDYIFLGRNPGESVSFLFNLGQYGQLWGIFILLGLVGIVHYRLTYFTNSIRLRKLEAVLLFWFSAAMLTIILGGGRLYLHYFYLLVPPLVIYVSKFFELKVRPWLRTVSIVGAFLIPVYTFGVYLASAYPKTFSFIDDQITPGGWIDNFRTQLNTEHPLAAYIDRDKVHNGILVLAYDPVIHARLDIPCATRYTNFSVAYYKLEALRDLTEVDLLSHTETLEDTYRAFREEMPEYIVDPLGIFPKMREKLPLLFQDYKARQVNVGKDSYKIYYQSALQG
ncbi:MAG: glycosyltransferase family 39 protein, partial [Bacteroidota bacterium]